MVTRERYVRGGAPGTLPLRNDGRRRPDQEPAHRAAGPRADERAQPPLAAGDGLYDTGGERDPAEDESPDVVARQDGGHRLARDCPVDGLKDQGRDAEREEGHDPEPPGDRDDGDTPEDPHGQSRGRTPTTNTRRSIGEATERVKLTGADRGARVRGDARTPRAHPAPPARPAASVGGDAGRRGAGAHRALPRGPHGGRPRARPSPSRAHAREPDRDDDHASLP